MSGGKGEGRCEGFSLAVQFGGPSGQQPGSNSSALQDEAQKPNNFFLPEELAKSKPDSAAMNY